MIFMMLVVCVGGCCGWCLCLLVHDLLDVVDLQGRLLHHLQKELGVHTALIKCLLWFGEHMLL